MTQTGVPARWRRRAWLLAFIGLFEFCNAANAQFIPVSGSADYATTGNWTNGIVNGQFTSPITGNLAVTFAADHAQTGSESGLLFSVNGGGNTVTFQSADSTARLLTLNGDIVTGPAGGNTVVIGSSANPLNLDLGGASRTFSVSNAADTVTVANTISGAGGTFGINKAGAGTLILSGANTFGGGVTIPSGRVVAQGPGTLGTGTVVMAGGTLSVGSGTPVTISGFGNGASWTTNGVADFPNSNVLQLNPTTGGTGSAWFNNRVPTGPFQLSFTFSWLGGSPGYGFTVGFQNSAQGLSALGTGGQQLGYAGISPSAVMALNASPPNTVGGMGSGVGFFKDGVTQYPVPSTGPINVANNQPTNFTLAYDGSFATVSLNQAGIGVYNTGPVPFNPPAVGPTAFLGFTGSAGGVLAQLQISNFSFAGVAAPGYSNNVVVTQNSTIQVAATGLSANVSMANLEMSLGTSLTLAPDPNTPVNQAFGLTFTSAALNGTNTFGVGANGATTGTLILNSVGDGASSGSIVKAGPGALTLAGTNTYTGSTTVAGGTLVLTGNGSFANSPTIVVGTAAGPVLDVSGVTGGANFSNGSFSLVAGQTIKGFGTVVGNTRIPVGATVAPGGSVGTLTINGNLFLDGTYQAEVSGPAADLLAANGSLTLTNNSLLDLLVANPDNVTPLTIATFSTLTGTFLPSNIENLPPNYQIEYEPNSIVLMPVPEPGSGFLLIVAGVAAATRRAVRGRKK